MATSHELGRAPSINYRKERAMSGVYQYKCVSCHELDWGGKYDLICDDCRSGHSAALLDAFYGAVPEKFANEERTAGCAAGIPLNDTDRMWLRGIKKAIFANHPLARMTRLDEEMGLYDDPDASVDRSPKGKKPQALNAKHESAAPEGGDAHE